MGKSKLLNLRSSFLLLLNILFIVFFLYIIKDMDYQLIKKFLIDLPKMIIITSFLLIFLSFLLKSVRFKMLNPIFILSKLALIFLLIFFKNILNFYSLILLILIIAMSFSIIFCVEWYIKLIKLIKKFVHLEFFLTILNGVERAFIHIRNLNASGKFFLIIISYLIWITSFLPYILIMKFSINLPFFNGFIIMLFGLFFASIPINLPLSVGTTEAGLLLGFQFFNVENILAINLSIFLHSFQIISLSLVYYIKTFFNLIKLYYQKFL